MMTTLSTSHCTDAENVSLVCDDEMQEMFHQLDTREALQNGKWVADEGY